MQRIALDTSIPSAYYNVHALERCAVTRKWWKHELPRFDVMIVEVTVSEIENTPDGQLRSRLRRLVGEFPVIVESTDSITLADTYIDERVIRREARNDARHIAAATVAEVDYLVSWNFVHLVNEVTRRGIERINRRLGLKPLRIVSPLELGGGKYEIQAVQG